MSDIYDELEEIKRRHEIEKHNESREEYQVDPSCQKCYSTDEIEIGDWFEKFWKIFRKVILEAKSYNRTPLTSNIGVQKSVVKFIVKLNFRSLNC
ncbi:unnamed protein product [Rhizophagus irregularis]|nr:unnamed protein product [Rhizophagus irregularis]